MLLALPRALPGLVAACLVILATLALTGRPGLRGAVRAAGGLAA
jgi:hypothetical protein